MRAFVCGQCHVEYYCGPKETLFYPWSNGLRVEQIEKTYDEHRFPDGHRFYDWKHAESGAEVLKAQHPEFEMWSQGIHARSGVTCADCHMPYKREGAMKVSDHWVRSPLLNVARACQVCHPYQESEILARVEGDPDTHARSSRALGRGADGHARRDRSGEEGRACRRSGSRRRSSSSAAPSGGSISSPPRTRWASTRPPKQRASSPSRSTIRAARR
jgi:hypothetical protein